MLRTLCTTPMKQSQQNNANPKFSTCAESSKKDPDMNEEMGKEFVALLLKELSLLKVVANQVTVLWDQPNRNEQAMRNLTKLGFIVNKHYQFIPRFHPLDLP